MRPLNKVNFIVVHCADSKTSMDVSVDTLRRWHVEENGWSDIGYHYFIKFNGTLHECRETKFQGAHCKAVNDKSLAICLEGGFNGENNFSQKQLSKLYDLIHGLKIQYPNAAVIGHGHIDEKACPSFDVVAWYEDKITANKNPIGFI